MNAKHFLSAVGPLMACILGTDPASAQQRVARPGGWPDAQTVIRQFHAGERSPAITAAVASCPSKNPYGDTVWVALLGREPTPLLSTRLASLWSSALVTCNDQRIVRWYQSRLRRSREHLGALPYLSTLLALRSRENVEFLKQIAFDESRDEELRSEILFRLSSRGTWDERLALYLDAYSRARRLPDPYAYNAYHALATSPVANRILERGLAAVEENPRNPNARRVLDFIGTDIRALQDAAWRARVRETLVRIEGNRQGRFPQELVQYARASRQALDAQPARPARLRP